MPVRKSHSGPHKYHKLEAYQDVKLWFCALPNCNHHMPKHYESSMVGKETICWECGKPTFIDGVTIGDDEPRCFDCRHPNHVALQKHLQDVGLIKPQDYFEAVEIKERVKTKPVEKDVIEIYEPTEEPTDVGSLLADIPNKD